MRRRGDLAFLAKYLRGVSRLGTLWRQRARWAGAVQGQGLRKGRNHLQIEVLLFASLRELADASSIALELPDSATVAELRSALAARFPELGARLSQMRVAIDHEFTGDDVPIPAGAEVALIPPVSGG